MAPRCKQCLSSVQTLIPKPMTKNYVCPKHGRISDPSLVEDVQTDVGARGDNNLSDQFSRQARRALGRDIEDPESVSWLSENDDYDDDYLGDVNDDNVRYDRIPLNKLPLSNNVEIE